MQFKMDAERLSTIEYEINASRIRILRQADRLRSISMQLRNSGDTASQELGLRLMKTAEQLEHETEMLLRMVLVLNKSILYYRRTEQEIADAMEGQERVAVAIRFITIPGCPCPKILLPEDCSVLFKRLKGVQTDGDKN